MRFHCAKTIILILLLTSGCQPKSEGSETELALSSIPKHWITLLQSETDKKTLSVDCEKGGIKLIIDVDALPPQILLAFPGGFDTTRFDIIGVLEKDALHTKFQVLEKSDTTTLDFKWIDKTSKVAAWSIGFFYSEFTPESNKENYPCYTSISASERMFLNMSDQWTLITKTDTADIIYQPCASELKRMEIIKDENSSKIVVYTGNDSDEFQVLSIDESASEVVSEKAELSLTTTAPEILFKSDITFKIRWLSEKVIECLLSSNDNSKTIKYTYVDSDYANEFQWVAEQDCY